MTLKLCTGVQGTYTVYCGKMLPLTEFNKHPTSADGLLSQCKTCVSTKRKNRNYEVSVLNKICKKCGENKPAADFHKAKDNTDGLMGICSDCTTVRNNKIHSNLDGFIKFRLSITKRTCVKKQRSFNINLDHVKSKYVEQNGKCSFTGENLTFNRDGKEGNDYHLAHPLNLSIDRIDSTIGYQPNNIQLVGTTINFMKLQLKDEDFINLCGIIVKNSENLNV